MKDVVKKRLPCKPFSGEKAKKGKKAHLYRPTKIVVIEIEFEEDDKDGLHPEEMRELVQFFRQR